MKLTILSATLTFTLVASRPQYAETSTLAEGDFQAAGSTDFRGPCPMMNTLANHGFLPRDGTNITLENAVKALGDGIGFNSELATIMWQQALIANPEPNATFFTLDNLNRHNVLEHDASLSRTDDFFGNNHIFNQTAFDESRSYWTADVVTAKMLADSKIARQITSRSTNPNYRFTNTTEAFSLGEVAAPIIVFGDFDAGTVPKDQMEFFFQNEKLPTELGWVKKSNVSLTQISGVVAIIANAQNLLTVDATPAAKRQDLHFGLNLKL